MSGALLAPLKLIFTIALIFIGITLAAWIVDWAFVFKVWPDGIHQLKSILAADLTRARDLARWQSAMPNAVTGTANLLYAMVFQVTGIHEMGMRFGESAALSITDTIARNTYLANGEAIEVAMIGTQLLGVRLATLVLLAPLVALAYVVGSVDGLAQRAIRRLCGGRESASLYHHAKHLQVAGLALFGATSFLIPISMDPRCLWMPATLILGGVARVQWAYYKKHL